MGLPLAACNAPVQGKPGLQQVAGVSPEDCMKKGVLFS